MGNLGIRDLKLTRTRIGETRIRVRDEKGSGSRPLTADSHVGPMELVNST